MGLTSKNIDQQAGSQNPSIQRFVGASGDIGKMLSLDNKWAYNIVKQVGNYGESFDANLKPLGFERGLNRLWNQGGLMYAPSDPVDGLSCAALPRSAPGFRSGARARPRPARRGRARPAPALLPRARLQQRPGQPRRQPARLSRAGRRRAQPVRRAGRRSAQGAPGYARHRPQHWRGITSGRIPAGTSSSSRSATATRTGARRAWTCAAARSSSSRPSGACARCSRRKAISFPKRCCCVTTAATGPGSISIASTSSPAPRPWSMKTAASAG